MKKNTILIASECNLYGTKIAHTGKTAWVTWLMMTAESMLSKRPVLEIIVALFFLLKFLVAMSV